MFQYERFGDLYLPFGNPTEDIGMPSVAPIMINLPNGYYDIRGTQPVPFEPLTLRIRRTFSSKNCNSANWADMYRVWRAAEGTEARLWRRWFDNRKLQFATAELVKVEAVHTLIVPNTLPVEFEFILKQDRWYGEAYGIYASTDEDFAPAPLLNPGLLQFPVVGSEIIAQRGTVENHDIWIKLLLPFGSTGSYNDFQLQNITPGYPMHGFIYHGIVTAPAELNIYTRYTQVIAPSGAGAWGAIELLGESRPDQLFWMHPGKNTITATGIELVEPSFVDPQLQLNFYGAHA